VKRLQAATGTCDAFDSCQLRKIRRGFRRAAANLAWNNMTSYSQAPQASGVAEYRATEVLRDGRRIAIRAARPADREALLEAFGRTGDESRYRRFFSPKHSLTEGEIAFFLNLDFADHVALVAELEGGERPVIAGGGRYIVAEPGRAEVAFMVDDSHQGLGIGSLLMRHLVVIARAAGLRTLVAEVLAGNRTMLKVFERAGLDLTTRREAGVLHLEMGLAPSQGSET
jgi:GNAT superfamily N-acetyltransferase